ncbi:glycosyltransferase 87 family protein [Actinoplanes sp. NPDC049265]|uniref:glycosyltransferase 87 family protein n=1 Tax=Actinoplanes sp. NPDC049265 TaxID=3363902 RepID=UPI0037182F15
MVRTRLIWAAAFSAATATAWSSLSRPVEDRLSDLHVYLGAAAAPSLYDFIRGDAPFTYPPFAAMLFRPLTAMPVPALQFLWTATTVITVAYLALLTTKALDHLGPLPVRVTRALAPHPKPLPPPPPPPPRPRPSWGQFRPRAPALSPWIALALTLSAPFSSNIHFGQISLFLAALIATDLLLLTNTRYAGILIGVASALKLTPLLFIPLLFLAALSPRQAAKPTATPPRRRPALPATGAPRTQPTPPATNPPHHWFAPPTPGAPRRQLTPPATNPPRRWFAPPTTSAHRTQPTPPATNPPRRWFAPPTTSALHRQAAALRAIATFAACTALGAIAAPADSLRFWTSEIFHVSRLGHITSIGNQSLNGLLLRLTVPDDPRTLITVTIGGIVAVTALWRATRHARAGDWLTATILTGAGSIVLSPVSWTHHQIWLVLAVLLPLRTPRAQAAWTTIVLAIMLLPTATFDIPLWTNARLFLAITIAALLPLRTPRAKGPRLPLEAIKATHATEVSEVARVEGGPAHANGNETAAKHHPAFPPESQAATPPKW